MTKKRHILKDLDMDEISGVTIPAQTPALAAIIKSAATKSEDGKDFPAKDYAYVPDPDEPSTWKLRLTSEPGGKPDPNIVGAAAAALGPGFRGNKVEIPEKDRAAVVARVRSAWKEAHGGKNPDDMPEALKKVSEYVASSQSPNPSVTDDLLKFFTDEEESMSDKTDELAKQNAELVAKIADLEVLAKMSDEEKRHLDSLKDDEAKKNFKAMSEADRKSHMKKMADADETVELEGRTVRKSVVGEDMFAILKSQADRIAKSETEIAKAKDEALTARLTKRADEDFGYLPGETVQKVAVLKAMESMPADARATLEQMLKAANEGLAPAFQTIGVEKTKEQVTKADRKAALVAEYRKSHPSASEAAAEVAVLETHPDLYE